MGKITAAITGVQGYVPERVMTNKDLEKIIDKIGRASYIRRWQGHF